MSLNVPSFSKFLDKTLVETNLNGIAVNEIKNLYNDVASRANHDYNINNNYLVVMLELYCICKQIDYKIVTVGGLKRLHGVTWASENVAEYAQIISNGLPNRQDADSRLNVLFSSLYKEVVAAA